MSGYINILSPPGFSVWNKESAATCRPGARKRKVFFVLFSSRGNQIQREERKGRERESGSPAENHITPHKLISQHHS
jgi:hypothetical protein